jgi:hypothetical protein
MSNSNNTDQNSTGGFRMVPRVGMPLGMGVGVGVPTTVRTYNPITGRVGPSWSNFNRNDDDELITEEFNKAGLECVLQGPKKSVKEIVQVLNLYAAKKASEITRTDEEVELGSESEVAKRFKPLLGVSSSTTKKDSGLSAEDMKKLAEMVSKMVEEKMKSSGSSGP